MDFHIGEFGQFLLKRQVDIAGGSVPVFGNDDFGYAVQ
jgi:hypothetical protein